MPHKPLALWDELGNSRILRLSQKEAEEFVSEQKSKNSNDIFYCMLEEDWRAHMEKQQYSEKDAAKYEEIQRNLNEMEGIQRKLNENDKSINGFGLPFILDDNEDYESKLKKILKNFIEEIDQPAFKKEDNLIKDVEGICEKIIYAFKKAKNGNASKAEEVISEILREYKKYPFAVSELDKNYAFRGIAPCSNLRQKEYEKEYNNMMEGDLSFFRARVVDKETTLSNREDINYLPFSKHELAKDMRFSSKNNICLYLGVTSFVCAEECQWDGEKNLYLSSFRFNEKGKKLKILNLAISQSLLNGMIPWDKKDVCRKEFYNNMLKVFPFTIATSFTTLKDADEKHDDKDEYLLSQILMDVLQKEGIDGVAYLSRQGEDDFQYPQMVCLAIPVKDSNIKDEYGKLVLDYVMTKPVLIESAIKNSIEMNLKSYINEKYPKYLNNMNNLENSTAKIKCKGETFFYQDTCYSRVDNYLVNQVHEKISCTTEEN